MQRKKEFMKKYLTNNSKQTFNLGKKFAGKLESGDIILLYGELGTGKTTFIQGVANGLGIKDRILSPTFLLHRIHPVIGHDFNRMNHIDLYRLENSTKISSIGIEDVFKEDGSVTFIEWAQRLKNFNSNKNLPAGRQGYKIIFKYKKENDREVRIERYG